MKEKTYLFYVRKSNVFDKGFTLYIYKCTTNDPLHAVGEIMYRSFVHVERIDFVQYKEYREKYWLRYGYKIYDWKDKYN